MHRAWRPAVLDLRISQRNNGSQWRATWACVYVCICFTHVLPKRPRSVCEMLSYSATSSFLVSCMLSLSSVTQLWTVTAFLSTTDWLKGELCGGGGGGLQFPSPLCSPLLQSSYSAHPSLPFPSLQLPRPHVSLPLRPLVTWSVKHKTPLAAHLAAVKKPLSAFWDCKKCHRHRWGRHQLFMLSAPHAWQGGVLYWRQQTQERHEHTHTKKKQNCCTDVPAHKTWSPDVRKICLHNCQITVFQKWSFPLIINLSSII